MRVTTIHYERTFNLGNYESQKLGVTVELGEGDNPLEALTRAKNFVEGNKAK